MMNNMMNIIKNKSLTMLTLSNIKRMRIAVSVLIVGGPTVVFANPVSEVLEACTKSATPCGYEELIKLVNGIIKYGITIIGLAFVLVLLYVGFQYLTSGGDISKVKKSRDMLNKVMWGMIYTLCGWVIVYFILKQLGVPADFYNKVLTS